jgi:RHS repeat-associated protein
MQSMTDKERWTRASWRPTLLALAVLATLAASLFFLGGASAQPAHDNSGTLANTLLPPNYSFSTTPGPGTIVDACATFQDVPVSHTDYAGISCATCLDAIEGFDCGGTGEPCMPPANAPYFRPAILITRGELTRLVAVVAGFSDPPGKQIYEDVPPSHAFYTWINRMSIRGHMSGFPCGTVPTEPCGADNLPYFRPDANVTRAQIAKIVSQSAGFSDDPGPQIYEDVPPSHTIYTWINRMSIRGHMSGFPCGTVPTEPCGPDNKPYFRPFDNVTRGQASTIVILAFAPFCSSATVTPSPQPATITPVPTTTIPPTATRTVTNIPSNTPVASTATATSTSAPCRTALPTATATPDCTIQFSDVPLNYTFYSFIHELVCRGIMSGYSDGTFRPNNDITRGQASKILANAAGLNDPIPPSGLTGAGVLISRQTFEDVPPSHTFWIWIERLAGQGTIGGYPCGGPFEPCASPANRPYFRPGNSITRGQASKIAALTANLTDPVEASQQRFADVSPNQPFWIWIEQMTGRSVMGGYPCGANVYEPCDPQNRPYFRPGNNITRAQASKIVANIFYPGGRAVVPGGPSASELLGDSNPSEATNPAINGANVNPATGNFWSAATDFAIDGRGPGLQLTRTYNALAAGVNGPFGFGWTSSYNMYIDGSTNPTVYQENGSTVRFFGRGPTYLHDSRVLAELARNGDGTYTFTRTQGQMRFIFNSQGKLTEIRDRNNYATTLTYSTNGLLTAMTDSANRQLLFTYGPNGLVSRIDDTAGNRHTSYNYNGQSLLTGATDVAGNTTQYGYDASNRMLTLSDPCVGCGPGGRVRIQNSYDALGRATGQIAPSCLVYDFSYNTVGNHTTTTITDPRAGVQVLTYTSNRLTKKVEDAAGPQPATWTYTYGGGYVSGLAGGTDPNGNTWRATWDARGNLLSSSDPLGRTTTITFNATNDPLTVRNPLGVTTTFSYDAAGNLLSKSMPLTETGQLATTRYGYDPAHPGDVVTITDPIGHVSHLTHDPLTGDVLTITNPLAESTHYTYDALGRVVSIQLDRQPPPIYSYTYNAYGDILLATSPVSGTTIYTYDPNRNLVTTQDANGHVTTTTYDLADRPVRVTRPDGTHSDTSYDAAGHLVRESNGLGQTTTHTYDAFNRLISSTDALNRTSHYVYDRAGRIASFTDSASPPRTTTYGYDNAGHLTSIAYSDGTTPNQTYTYDGKGRRTSMTDGTGTTIYAYDSLDRLVQERNGAGKTVTYGYDLAGNVLTLGYPAAGHTVVHTYDAANRLSTVRDWLNNTTSFLYDSDGNLTAKIYPNGTRVDQAYDLADRLTGITHSHNGSPFLALSYTRDPLGLLQGLTDSGDGSRTYQYDTLDRLTGDDHGPLDVRTWANDGAYQITGSTTQANGVQLTTTRGYDAANELRTLVETQDAPPSVRTLALTYNGVGDRVSQTDTLNGPTTYGYDHAGRLTSYSHGGTLAGYSYDGDGLRMSKQIGSNVQQFTWASRLLLSDDVAEYIYGPDGLPLEEVLGGAPYFYHLDQLGSTRALTDGAGNVASTRSYDPYGVPLSSTGSVNNPFGYAGEYRDAESGLIYLRARYYDPITQQFLTVDPLVGDTKQAYAYVGGSPLNATDPTGMIQNFPNGYCKACHDKYPSWLEYSHCEYCEEEVHSGRYRKSTIGDWSNFYLCMAEPWTWRDLIRTIKIAGYGRAKIIDPRTISH